MFLQKGLYNKLHRNPLSKFVQKSKNILDYPKDKMDAMEFMKQHK